MPPSSSLSTYFRMLARKTAGSTGSGENIVGLAPVPELASLSPSLFSCSSFSSPSSSTGSAVFANTTSPSSTPNQATPVEPQVVPLGVPSPALTREAMRPAMARMATGARSRNIRPRRSMALVVGMTRMADLHPLLGPRRRMFSSRTIPRRSTSRRRKVPRPRARCNSSPRQWTGLCMAPGFLVYT